MKNKLNDLKPLFSRKKSLTFQRRSKKMLCALDRKSCRPEYKTQQLKRRDPFNQNSDREKWSTSKGGPVFSKIFRLDRTYPLSFGPKFPEILVEWIAPHVPYRPLSMK